MRNHCDRVNALHLEPWVPGAKGINIVGGQGSARGNRADLIGMHDNLVNGVLDDFAVFADLDGASVNTVTFAQLSGPGNAPYYAAVAVVNAASFRSPIAPGSNATLFGANLATRQEISAYWPFDLAGASIRLNGIAAPLYFVSPGQVSFQVPWELAGRTQTTLSVTVNSVTGPPQTAAVAPYNPGLFVTNAKGQGRS